VLLTNPLFSCNRADTTFTRDPEPQVPGHRLGADLDRQAGDMAVLQGLGVRRPASGWSSVRSLFGAFLIYRSIDERRSAVT